MRGWVALLFMWCSAYTLIDWFSGDATVPLWLSIINIPTFLFWVLWYVGYHEGKKQKEAKNG